MRKRSKKPTITEYDKTHATPSVTIPIEERLVGDKLQAGSIVNLQSDPEDAIIRFQRMPDGLDLDILDILLRLCDACHEMDTRTEPWASIRKDIERLK